jgi:hypothetical protein
MAEPITDVRQLTAALALFLPILISMQLFGGKVNEFLCLSQVAAGPSQILDEDTIVLRLPTHR